MILAQGGRVIPLLMQKTRSIPIVVPGIADPVGAGLVESLARPGGNVTGFSLIEFSVIGKMLEMLKQIAPGTSRVALIYNADNPNTALFVKAFERFAGPLAIKPVLSSIREFSDFERAVENLLREPNGGISSRRTSRSLRGAIPSSSSSHNAAFLQSIRMCCWSRAAG